MTEADNQCREGKGGNRQPKSQKQRPEQAARVAKTNAETGSLGREGEGRSGQPTSRRRRPSPGSNDRRHHRAPDHSPPHSGSFHMPRLRRNAPLHDEQTRRTAATAPHWLHDSPRLVPHADYEVPGNRLRRASVELPAARGTTPRLESDQPSI
jgi:hypothetical protein